MTKHLDDWIILSFSIKKGAIYEHTKIIKAQIIF